MALPGFKNYDLEDVAFLLSFAGLEAGRDALLASGQTGPLASPTFRIVPGQVVVLETGDGKFYLADDITNGDRNLAAVKITTSYVTGNGLFVLVGNHGTISVTTATGSGDADDAVTDLTADTEFARHYLAENVGGELQISNKEKGADQHFYIDATSRDQGFTEGPANGVIGTDADYRVTAWYADLEDLEGVAVDNLVRTVRKGHLNRTELRNLTAEAESVLVRRGSHIEVG